MLLFAPDQNLPNKNDALGAFLPEARAFARYHDVEPDDVIVRFPAHAPIQQRRSTCTLALRALTVELDVLAFFCHGWKAGIQAGFVRPHTLLLARLVAQYAKVDAHVLFYACDTGRDQDDDTSDDREPGPGGDGGFADELRDGLDMLGRRVTVVGHTTTGHCSQNPYARYFAPQCGGQGGRWFVEPQSAAWPLWVRALKDPRNSLRYRFWSMTPEAIAAELAPAVA
jgi:hypothetical protein